MQKNDSYFKGIKKLKTVAICHEVDQIKKKETPETGNKQEI